MARFGATDQRAQCEPRNKDVGLAREELLRRVLHDYFAWATTTRQRMCRPVCASRSGPGTDS
jgi:hypothetical protein